MTTAPPSPNPIVRGLGAPTRAADQFTQWISAGTRRQVSRLCWTFLIGFIAWDVYLALDATPDNTWSEAMRVASGRHPVLPWLVGLLVGHLFHPRDHPEPVIDREAATTVLTLVTLALAAFGFGAVAWPLWWALALALVGLLTASFVWPMERKTENWRW